MIGTHPIPRVSKCKSGWKDFAEVRKTGLMAAVAQYCHVSAGLAYPKHRLNKRTNRTNGADQGLRLSQARTKRMLTTRPNVQDLTTTPG